MTKKQLYTTISVDGPIATGKSDLLEALAATGAFGISLEPVKQWREGFDENALDLLYTDAKRWTFAFQILAFVTRAASLRKLQARTDHDYILTERSVWSDRYVFAELGYLLGNMSKIELEIYRALWDLMPPGPPPRITFYLRTPAATCLERILERGRIEEEGIDLAFLLQLEDLYDRWMFDRDDVVVLDGLKTTDELVEDVVRAIGVGS